jgi:hypothetical protein
MAEVRVWRRLSRTAFQQRYGFSPRVGHDVLSGYGDRRVCIERVINVGRRYVTLWLMVK